MISLHVKIHFVVTRFKMNMKTNPFKTNEIANLSDYWSITDCSKIDIEKCITFNARFHRLSLSTTV
jgi:hypothetical protein